MATVAEHPIRKLNYPRRFWHHVKRLWDGHPNPLVRYWLIPTYAVFAGAYVVMYWLIMWACMLTILLPFFILRYVRPVVGVGVIVDD